jgi:hypothetical protein
MVDVVEGRVDRSVRGAFIASCVRPHPDGAVVFVAGDRGRMQAYDVALNPIG